MTSTLGLEIGGRHNPTGSDPCFELFRPFDTEPVSIILFGRPFGWRLKGDNRWLLEEVARVANLFSVTKILAPGTRDCNRAITKAGAFPTIDLLPGGVTLEHGLQADGARLEPGEALLLRPADCPTTIVINPELKRRGRLIRGRRVLAAHSGRDCLIDRPAIQKRQAGRASVVDELIRQAQDPRADDRLLAHVCLGIAPKHFGHDSNHPEWGPFNRRLAGYLKRHHPTALSGDDPRRGQLDLVALIRSQFKRSAPSGSSLTCDSWDTYGDTDESGEPIWYSRRRSQDLDDHEIDYRNLVVVLHET